MNLEFDLKIEKFSNTMISFEDYSGKKMSIDLLNYINLDYGEWKRVKIPMKKFPIYSSNIDLKIIKSVVFSFSDDTKLKIDDIKLIK